MVALGADVSRQGPETRKAFEAQVEALIGLAESVSAAPVAGRRDEAIRTVATMLGAMLMARATHGSKLASEVLAAARE
jgi:TetR/AcrR family transcriptional repressor of nem operon